MLILAQPHRGTIGSFILRRLEHLESLLLDIVELCKLSSMHFGPSVNGLTLDIDILDLALNVTAP